MKKETYQMMQRLSEGYKTFEMAKTRSHDHSIIKSRPASHSSSTVVIIWEMVGPFRVEDELKMKGLRAVVLEEAIVIQKLHDFNERQCIIHPMRPIHWLDSESFKRW